MTSPDTGFYLENRRYVTGIVLLLIVVFLWTLSNFITQALFSNGYHKPFLSKDPPIPRNSNESDGYEPLPAHIPTGLVAAVDTSDIREEHNNLFRSNDSSPLSTRETARLACSFCFLWFIANWSVNAALDYVSVGSTTILSSTSGFITLVLGYSLGVETMTATKIITVATSFVGVLLVCLSDNSQSGTSPSRPILGDFLAVLSALFYALYVLLLKLRVKEESRINMQLFFGFVGMFNITLMIPVAIILHILGYEKFSLPHTTNEWGAVVINMFITWSSDYLYVLAMLKTTPVVVTIGLSLTIPLAVIGDTLLDRTVLGQAIAGASLVLLSFVILGWNSAKPQTPHS
ncbi:hypothetical protein Clacol_003739 [Clathrus columnatus]|uniref:Solute carrier family 35 member F5 n=1 Tax=Clathrus columnatus TaxID=1419009 RepID=A0AAV5AAH5_9AGAM|nr:hypothetical protein Clacol_003739 [Clathrus columnatus]